MRDFREFDAPVAEGSGQPFLSRAGADEVGLSWLEPAGQDRYRLRYAESHGEKWSEPRTAAEAPTFFVNWADVPSVVRLPDGQLAAHYLDKSGPDTYAYDVKIRVSGDRGARWSDPLMPHRDGTQTEHGFVTLFPWVDGGVGMVWLDGRNFAKVKDHEAHDGPSPAEMTLRAASLGPGRTLQNEALLDGRVCECCPTTAVRTPKGVLVAYRDRSENEIRDIHLVRFESGSWSEPYPVHRDNWKISGCPVNGPALAALDDRVALAWFLAPEGQPRAMVAFSRDGGASFGDPIRVDDRVPLGRVDVELLDDGSALVGWIEYNEGNSEFRVRQVSATGRRGPSVRIASVSSERRSGFPRMVRVRDRLFFAWTATAPERRVRTAIARLGGEE